MMDAATDVRVYRNLYIWTWAEIERGPMLNGGIRRGETRAPVASCVSVAALWGVAFVVGSIACAPAAAQTFDVPPSPDVEALRTSGPIFTPYAAPPVLKNREAINAAIEREHPAGLRDQGIGGAVWVGFLVDEAGGVVEALPGPCGTSGLDWSSGHRELDEAALRVARLYEFEPAVGLEGGPTPVWIFLPILFEPLRPGPAYGRRTGCTVWEDVAPEPSR